MQQKPHQVVYAGPGIPAFRVGVPFAVSDLDAAAAFFRDFLEPYFGRREIFGTGHHLTNACIIAALPPGTPPAPGSFLRAVGSTPFQETPKVLWFTRGRLLMG